MSVVKDFNQFRLDESIVFDFTQFRKEEELIVDFTKFREDELVANFNEFQENVLGVPFTPVSTPPQREGGVLDIDVIKEQLMSDPEFKGFVTPDLRWFGSGSGVSPGRVNALESRLSVAENGFINYITITATGTTTYTRKDLLPGINIVGVNAPGDVTIRLPDNLSIGTIVEINDESLEAGTNNITIITYEV